MAFQSQLDNILKLITPPILRTFIKKLFYNHKISRTSQILSNHTKLHLGSGTNVIEGWANIDLLDNAKVVYWNLTTHLPINSGRIQFIYTEHFIEHITMQQGRNLIKECFRVLSSGGILRISTPNLKQIIEEYSLGNQSSWRNLKYSSNTGTNYTPCRMVNDAMRLWGHEFIYDEPELINLLKTVGFKQVSPVKWRESVHKELSNLESRSYYGDIILEAIK